MPAALDMTMHHPARLQIVAALTRADDIEFAVLRDLVEISDSVLSKHLSALAESGYVKLVKAAQDGRQRTWASATARGRKAFRAHVQALQDMVANVQTAAAG